MVEHMGVYIQYVKTLLPLGQVDTDTIQKRGCCVILERSEKTYFWGWGGGEGSRVFGHSTFLTLKVLLPLAERPTIWNQILYEVAFEFLYRNNKDFFRKSWTSIVLVSLQQAIFKPLFCCKTSKVCLLVKMYTCKGMQLYILYFLNQYPPLNNFSS